MIRLALCVLASACTHPMPPVPYVASDFGGACVDHCQARYESCLSSSQRHLGFGWMAYAADANNREALNACRDNLTACYRLCAGR